MNKENLSKVLERVKQVIFHPKDTWETIKEEDVSVQELTRNYLLVLAAVPAVASFLGMWLVGYWVSIKPLFRLSFGRALSHALLGYILTVAGIWAIGKAIGFFASRFGSQISEKNAFALSVYSHTPFLAIGVLNIFPALSVLVLLAGIYSLYVLYLGLPVMAEVPEEKTLPFTIVLIVSMICIYLVISWMTSLLLGPVLY